MTPLPVNPKVVVLLDADGHPIRIASNIAPIAEMGVFVTKDVNAFNEEALGKPFNETALPIPDDYIR